MEDIISKELLCEVLKVDAISRNIKSNIVYYNGIHDCGSINIHELANLTIDWLETQDYWIKKPSKNSYELCWGSAEVFRVYTEDRHTVPFICGQAILKNKKDK